MHQYTNLSPSLF